MNSKQFNPYQLAACQQRSVGDPYPDVFGPPGSGSIIQMFGSGFLPFLIKVLSRLKLCLQNKILTQNFFKNLIFRLQLMCLWVSYKKKNMKKISFFASLKSLKKVVDPDLLVRGKDTLILIHTKYKLHVCKKEIYKIWCRNRREKDPKMRQKFLKES